MTEGHGGLGSSGEQDHAMTAQECDGEVRLSDRLSASRECDAKIADTVKWWPKGYTRDDCHGPDRRWYDRDDMPPSWLDCPPYTTSHDAALTLYLERPRFVSVDPLQVCVDALKQRGL